MALRRPAQTLEKTGRGRDGALVGLDDHRRQFVVMRVDERLGGGQIVVGRDQHLTVDHVRNAGGVGHGRREGLRRPRHHAHEHVVVRAMEAALEFHDLVALAIGARHAQREERRLAAAGRVAHLLGARHGGHDFLGQSDRGLVHDEIRGAARHLPLHGVHHRGMRVAEQHRPGAEQVVEIAPSVHVEEIGAAALTHDELEAGARAVTAEKPTGKHARGAREQLVLISHGKTILAEGAS